MSLSGARTQLFRLVVTCRQAHWLRLATADLAIRSLHEGDTAYKAPGQAHCR